MIDQSRVWLGQQETMKDNHSLCDPFNRPAKLPGHSLSEELPEGCTYRARVVRVPLQLTVE
jgi:hypothetical protein